MLMDTMQNLSWNLLLKSIVLLVQVRLVSWNGSFAIMVSTIFSPLFHFPDKLKYLSSADHIVCPTSILIYLQVLFHVNSRISSHCTTSCEFPFEIVLHHLVPSLIGY